MEHHNHQGHHIIHDDDDCQVDTSGQHGGVWTTSREAWRWRTLPSQCWGIIMSMMMMMMVTMMGCMTMIIGYSLRFIELLQQKKYINFQGTYGRVPKNRNPGRYFETMNSSQNVGLSKKQQSPNVALSVCGSLGPLDALTKRSWEGQLLK